MDGFEQKDIEIQADLDFYLLQDSPLKIPKRPPSIPKSKKQNLHTSGRSRREVVETKLKKNFSKATNSFLIVNSGFPSIKRIKSIPIKSENPPKPFLPLLSKQKNPSFFRYKNYFLSDI